MGVTEAKQRLKNLCAIFEIPLEAAAHDEAAALAILTQVYVVPAIQTKAEKVRYGNAILANAGKHFPPWSPFVLRVGQQLALMQSWPAFNNDYNMTAQQVAERYQDLERQIYWMGVLGVGGSGASAVGAGAGRGIETGSAKEGVKRLGERLSGKGALVDGIQKRLGPGMAARANVAGAVVIGGATIGYYSALKQMEKLKQIMLHKFQNKEATDEQYRMVFGNDSHPELVKKYWEL